MSVWEVLRDRLVGFQAVADLVGTRIYPGALPPAVVYPAITYSAISARPVGTHGNMDLVASRFQFTAWDKSFVKADQVRTAVMQAMNGWRPDPGSDVQSVYIAGWVDQREPDTAAYMAIVDFIVWHRVAVAA